MLYELFNTSAILLAKFSLLRDKLMPYKDYRYQDYQATTLAQDSINLNAGITSNPGEVVIAAGEVQYDTEHVLSFPLPNVTAMCLDIAYSNWVASQHFLQDEKFLRFFKPDPTKGIVILTEDYTFFDLLQMRMIAIVFAYTALESFANESIPDHFIFRSKRYGGPHCQDTKTGSNKSYFPPFLFCDSVFSIPLVYAL